jgi:hypothetical protein
MKEKLKDKDNIDSIDKLINAMKVLWGKDLSRGYLKRSSSMTRMPQKVLAVNGNAISC